MRKAATVTKRREKKKKKRGGEGRGRVVLQIFAGKRLINHAGSEGIFPSNIGRF